VTRDLLSAAYWVRIDAIARRAGFGGCSAPAGRPCADTGRGCFTLSTTAKTVTIDGTAVRLRPAAALSFIKTPKGWTQGPAGAAALQGPIVEAVNARHIYVYGADDPQTRSYAETAAAWSSKRAHLNLKLPVKSDRGSMTTIWRANLVLFGTPRPTA
jgi:hypothetical protein